MPGSRLTSKQRLFAALLLGSIATAQNLVPGVPVPGFAFTDFTGKSRSFREYQGKVVLVDFWATWCKPCLADIPHLKELYAKYRASGFEIIGMDAETVGQDAADIDAALLKDQEARARQIVVQRGAVWSHATNATATPLAAVFGAKTLPTKVLIDRQGKVAARIKKVEELDQLLPGLLDAKR
jgi:thiol-disulfide isomerase/thioredoxin